MAPVTLERTVAEAVAVVTAAGNSKDDFCMVPPKWLYIMEAIVPFARAGASRDV